MPKYSTEIVTCLPWVNFTLSLKVFQCDFSGAITKKLLAVLQALWKQKLSACICVSPEDANIFLLLLVTPVPQDKTTPAVIKLSIKKTTWKKKNGGLRKSPNGYHSDHIVIKKSCQDLIKISVKSSWVTRWERADKPRAKGYTWVFANWIMGCPFRKNQLLVLNAICKTEVKELGAHLRIRWKCCLG